MKVLLDTCTFLWLAGDDPQLSRKAKSIFLSAEEVFLSAVSAWEISVKFASGRLGLPEPPVEFIPSRRLIYGLSALPIDEREATYVSRLPRHHQDPFDRILICQSIVHHLPILSPDRLLAQYPVRLLW